MGHRLLQLPREIFSCLTLRRVLYVPALRMNLISISRLCDSGTDVSFSAVGCCVQHSRTKATVGLGTKTRGLYHLAACATSASTLSSFHLHHSRLGHPSLSVMRKFPDSIHPPPDFTCHACELGKHTRSPRADTRSSSPFALVHCDVWGLRSCLVLSISLFLLMTLVVYHGSIFLNLVLQCIPRFYIFMLKYFWQRLVTFRTDNARELLCLLNILPQTALSTPLHIPGGRAQDSSSD